MFATNSFAFNLIGLWKSDLNKPFDTIYFQEKSFKVSRVVMSIQNIEENENEIIIHTKSTQYKIIKESENTINVIFPKGKKVTYKRSIGKDEH